MSQPFEAATLVGGYFSDGTIEYKAVGGVLFLHARDLVLAKDSPSGSTTVFATGIGNFTAGPFVMTALNGAAMRVMLVNGELRFHYQVVKAQTQQFYAGVALPIS